MTEQNLPEVEPTAVLTGSKWIFGLSPDELVCQVAGRVLGTRLGAVCHFLPLAAEKSDEDVEHVHQLRISVRRAVEAIKIFSGLMEEAEVIALQDRLQRIRLAADEARNWDVLYERFSQGSCITSKIVEQIKVRRRDAQEPIVAVYREIAADACEAKIEKLIQEVKSHCRGGGRFGREAYHFLRPVVKKFFRAAESDLTADESFHRLRIRTKKLRYTMEIVAFVFDSAFRKKLYPQVTLFQDLLGTVNDHATAKMLFQDWLSKSEDAEQKAFLEGLLLAEERASVDLRAAFLATWTPKVVSDLKRRFRSYR